MILPYIVRIARKTFQDAQSDSEAWRAKHNSKGLDFKVITVCIVAAICITLTKYLGDSADLCLKFRCLMPLAIRHPGDFKLWFFAWWVLVIFIFYFIVPALVVTLVFRESLLDYGLKLKGAFVDYKLYLLMMVIMVPIVVLVSYEASFQERYPLFGLRRGETLHPDIILYEFLYFIQFAALEFFFRGFILHGLKHRFEYYAVFIMMIPYCMIHFGKPLPETLAAIVAGIVLGTLSLKNKSIWLCLAIHFGVALTMEIAALWQKGFL